MVRRRQFDLYGLEADALRDGRSGGRGGRGRYTFGLVFADVDCGGRVNYGGCEVVDHFVD